jgi:putative ABC transport system substrate-binding protein
MGAGLAAFRAGLKEIGFVEGQNVAIEYRWAEGNYQRLPALIAELVQRRVAVIMAGGGSAPALAAKAATSTIPIVFSTGGDPVKSGLVPSLSRPGGNMTGAFILSTELETKRLELLHEVVPGAGVIGVLVNPAFSEAELQIKALQVEVQAIGKQIVVARASDEAGIHRAFTAFTEARAGALLVASDPFLFSQRKHIVALAGINALPAIYQWREFAEAGGLMSYGTALAETYRLVGGYVGRILKGEKAGELPVIQSTKVEFVINLKTARSLGLTIPLPLFGRANEVFE